MQRTAQCCCGGVQAVAAGEPNSVVACHCVQCQRRTGSVLGVGAYYPKESVTVSGDTRQYDRATESGNRFITHFCAVCGTSVYWFASRSPELIGIAVGAFGDPSFPQPVRSVWEQSMHSWVEVTPATNHFPKGRVA